MKRESEKGVRDQKGLDQQNAAFWDELCGSSLARSLGIKDHFEEGALEKFDDAYLGLYPYLLRHIDPDQMKGGKVLEVGLGYGTVGQKIAEKGADFYGLDIAKGPVGMMNFRLRMKGYPEKAEQGSVLDCPFESNFFDHVVSIGCFHHTGNIQRCFDETHRILKPGGRAIIMVYNKYSYRQWRKNFFPTFYSLFSSNAERLKSLDEKNRKNYDANLEGTAAPEIVLSSQGELRKMLKNFKDVSFSKENFDGATLRKYFLNSVAKVAGLDIYIECYK